MEIIEINESRANLQKAIADAQAEMHNPAFDKDNPYFKSKFASLAAVRNAVVPVLAKHGVSVFQDLTDAEGGVACTTILAGFGVEMRFGPFTIPAAKRDAHGYAAAGTYAKRVHLQAVLCVVGDEDDDGNEATASTMATDIKAVLAEEDITEEQREDALHEIHKRAWGNNELMLAVGEKLSAKQQRQFKEYIANWKKRSDGKMLPNGRAA